MFGSQSFPKTSPKSFARPRNYSDNGYEVRVGSIGRTYDEEIVVPKPKGLNHYHNIERNHDHIQDQYVATHAIDIVGKIPNNHADE